MADYFESEEFRSFSVQPRGSGSELFVVFYDRFGIEHLFDEESLVVRINNLKLLGLDASTSCAALQALRSEKAHGCSSSGGVGA